MPKYSHSYAVVMSYQDSPYSPHIETYSSKDDAIKRMKEMFLDDIRAHMEHTDKEFLHRLFSKMQILTDDKTGEIFYVNGVNKTVYSVVEVANGRRIIDDYDAAEAYMH